MLKSTSSPLLLFQRKFMLYHQSFSHFLLFIITLCHRKIFTLRIMLYYRFLCNFVHCKQFFFLFQKTKRKTICVLVCMWYDVCADVFWMYRNEFVAIFVWKFILSEVSIIDELKFNCGKEKICDCEHVCYFCCHLFIHVCMYGIWIEKFYSKLMLWPFSFKGFFFISVQFAELL